MTGRPPGEARDLSSLEETLDILTTPGEAAAIREGLADAAAGNFEDNQAIKRRVPPVSDGVPERSTTTP